MPEAHRITWSESAYWPGRYFWICTCGQGGRTQHRFKGHAELAGLHHVSAKAGGRRA